MPERDWSDVAIVGAGPAGIAAAVSAAAAGARVTLIDSAPGAGGQIWRHRSPSDLPKIARGWLGRLDDSNVRFLSGAIISDIGPGLSLRGEIAGKALAIDAAAIVLATGASERFIPFPGWTLPGVLGVGGLQALAKSGASFRKKRIVVAGSGPLLLPVAATLARGGARIVSVAEQAPPGRVVRFALGLLATPARAADAARFRAAFRDAPYRFGTWVTRVDSADHGLRVTLTDGRSTWTERCDLLGVGYGLTPSTELARLAGCAVDGGRVSVLPGQRTSVTGIYAAGEATGIGGAERALEEGTTAGAEAAGQESAVSRGASNRSRFVEALARTFALREELRSLVEPSTIVCRCEDVPWGAIQLDWSARQARLSARVGMGPCQGRVCGPALEFLRGAGLDSVRPPLFPVFVGSLAVGAEPDKSQGGA